MVDFSMYLDSNIVLTREDITNSQLSDFLTEGVLFELFITYIFILTTLRLLRLRNSVLTHL